ncbi:MAG: ketopantoate reductase family protein [Halobacteria archaeon]|nr:ketopantoate reductase family protein [Halobacteria archaeon]
MKVQVMGAGSLGSLVGGILSHGGLDVHLVGREEHIDEVNDQGLRVRGELEFTSKPGASTRPVEADITLLTVKSFDTRDAALQLKGMQNVVVSLQNGMGNEEVLSDVLDCEILAGTTTYGANLVGAGVVECTGEGEVDIGAPEGGESDTADKIVHEFDGAGVVTKARDDMPRRLWEKLAVNAGINPVTALTRFKNGDAASESEWVVRQAAKEVESVANARGVKVEEADEKAVEVAKRTAANESSMLQDVKKGRKTEIDAINGYVVEKGREKNVDTKINRTLLELVKGLEVTQE